MANEKGSLAETRAYALSRHKGDTVTVSLEPEGYRVSSVTKHKGHTSSAGLSGVELVGFIRRHCVAAALPTHSGINERWNKATGGNASVFGESAGLNLRWELRFYSLTARPDGVERSYFADSLDELFALAGKALKAAGL